ncbi:class II aldolase/adducin family protein [Candidatus Woesearchaeota archaeon]|nr:class II aldolase/adducin family protein [Candidatus Woesearchaeota archaeon]
MSDEEGYVKYSAHLVKELVLPEEALQNLNLWRGKMLDLNLIGMYSNGIGFGNISEKMGDDFIITATATGGIKKLSAKYYPKVTSYNLETNSVEYEGLEAHPPSSEAMTHAAVYESDPAVRAIIHVHNLEMWKRILNKVPTTSKDAAYGTPEMANEIIRLFRETDVKDKKILAMAGHEEGIITFGKDLTEAGNIMLEYFSKH